MHPDLGAASRSSTSRPLLCFLSAWWGYSYAVEHLAGGKRSLNGMMNRYRHAWADQQIVRENRVVDTTINPRSRTAPPSSPPRR